MKKIIFFGIILVAMLGVAAKMIPTANPDNSISKGNAVADSNGLQYRDDADYTHLSHLNHSKAINSMQS